MTSLIKAPNLRGQTSSCIQVNTVLACSLHVSLHCCHTGNHKDITKPITFPDHLLSAHLQNPAELSGAMNMFVRYDAFLPAEQNTLSTFFKKLSVKTSY
jgi:hypothetical protein